MTDNTEDQLPTEESRTTYTEPPPHGWQPDGSYITPSTEWFLQQATARDKFPTQACDTNEVPPTDWVRQQVLNNRAKAAGYEGTGKPVPLGEGWTTAKLAPSLPKQMLATKEYVDQQVAEAMESIDKSMDMSGRWVNRRIAEEIAKERAASKRFLLYQAVCFVVGVVIGWLVVGWLWM